MFKPAIDVEALKPKRNAKLKIKELAYGLGFTEVYNYSFSSPEELTKFMCFNDSVITLQNPLSSDASVLRNYLYPGILKNI